VNEFIEGEQTWRIPEPSRIHPKYHQEEAVVGVPLESYTKREPSDDGTYVKITSHSERIEKIKQPPTPEEKAAQQKQERIAAGVVGGIVLGFVGLVGWLSWLDSKEPKRHLKAVPDQPEE
jgi:hypothetical protein